MKEEFNTDTDTDLDDRWDTGELGRDELHCISSSYTLKFDPKLFVERDHTHTEEMNNN